jgi:hypothetical protein
MATTFMLINCPSASAGGSSLEPERERYAPGDTATLRGYVGRGQLGWVEDGPFPAWLRTAPVSATTDESPLPGRMPGDLPIGELVIEETGQGGYLELHISITFQIPSDLDRGTYEVVYCNADCSTGIGDLIGGLVHVSARPEVATTVTPNLRIANAAITPSSRGAADSFNAVWVATVFSLVTGLAAAAVLLAARVRRTRN